MEDSDKIKEQLMNELEQLRQQLVQLKSPETRREQMGKASREGEKCYRDIVEDQTELLCRFLPDGTLTFVNEAYCRYFSKRREELIGHSFMPLILSKDCEGIKERIASLSRKKFVTTHEHCVLASGGEIRWLEWTIRAIFGKGSRVIELQAVGRDITERKQAGEKLRQSEEKYRTLVSRIPDVAWTTDEEGHVVFVSPNIEAICGYTQEEEYKMGMWISWFDRVHPDEAKDAKAAYTALIKEGEPYNVECRFKRKDGSWVWLHDRSVVAYEKDGVWYADGLLSDITKRKQAEAEIRKLKEKYESVIRNIPDTIYSCLPDETCSMVFISDRYKDWTGYSPQDFYGDHGLWPKTVHPEDRYRVLRTYIEACRKKKAYLSEYRVIHKDTGQIRWVRDHGMPVTDESGKLILFDGVISDITEQKQMEVRLDAFQQRLRSLASQISMAEERERRRIAAGLHDQVTQTLAVIKMKLGTLRELSSSNNHSKQLDEIRGLIDETIQETRSLTFDLSPPVLYELGLEAAVEWLIERFQERYGIVCKFEGDCQPKPLGDELRGTIFIATRELLLNVMKHAQARTVTVSVRREHNTIRLVVQDDGIGFNPSEVGKRDYGFGLFNIRERLKYLGGYVEIESDRGCGTRVTLVAPLQSIEKAQGEN
jgi:PAS domain S-box-containing protein